MAKVKSLIRLSGKLGDVVYVDSKYGNYARKATAPKSASEGFKLQRNRTGFLSKLGSEVNGIIGQYADGIKRPDFFNMAQSRFRKEPLNNRFMLLKQLVGMNVHVVNPEDNKGCTTGVVDTTNPGKILVTLEVDRHPLIFFERKVNCYYYEVILVCWHKGKKPVTHARQYSDWIKVSKQKPEFEFVFPLAAGASQWMFCLKKRLGINGKAIEDLLAGSMQIMAVGSFEKRDKELLYKREAEERAKQLEKQKEINVDDVVRVKAKRMG